MSEYIVALTRQARESPVGHKFKQLAACYNEYFQSSEPRGTPKTCIHSFFDVFLHTQAKLSLRLEYIPPKPGKSVEGEITATDETDLGTELDDEFGLQEEEGMDELEGGGAAGVSETAR